MDTQTERVVRKSVVVPLTRDAAFDLFTAGIGSWWPVETHAIADGEVVAFVDGRVGGMIGERTVAGTEPWGTITEWDPPQGFASTWHPGYAPALATRLRVTFVEVGPSETRVDLEHRGWEVHGAAADERVASYDTGWDAVLGRYGAQAA